MNEEKRTRTGVPGAALKGAVPARPEFGAGEASRGRGFQAKETTENSSRWQLDLVEMESITPATVKAHALETFGSKRKADHWLSRRNPLFKGKTPLEIMQENPSRVEAALTRIDHGVYV